MTSIPSKLLCAHIPPFSTLGYPKKDMYVLRDSLDLPLFSWSTLDSPIHQCKFGQPDPVRLNDHVRQVVIVGRVPSKTIVHPVLQESKQYWM